MAQNATPPRIWRCSACGVPQTGDYCHEARPGLVISPFVRRALGRELPAKDTTR